MHLMVAVVLASATPMSASLTKKSKWPSRLLT